MSALSPAHAIAQPVLAGIAETTEALRNAVGRSTADLEAVEKELVATGAEIEFLMWEPIRQTERRFVGSGDTCAADSAWCLGYCRVGPSQVWRLVVREYHREYEPVGTPAPVRIMRGETPVVESAPELQLAALDHLLRFLESFHDALRQTLSRSQARIAQRPVSRPRISPRGAPQP
jgi:hypothetical protein